MDGAPDGCGSRWHGIVRSLTSLRYQLIEQPLRHMKIRHQALGDAGKSMTERRQARLLDVIQLG